jgi:predicted acetylornithine/succinylornithine family transaminase
MNNRDVAKLTDKYVAQTYARYPVALVRGKGSRVWDADGKEYLDLLAGIAVNSLGHCHPAVVRAIQQQARKLLHVSNLYHIQPQSELARELCRNSFADRVFFCNSGAEANEAAIKLARRYGGEHLGGRYEILSAQNSFHGRTLATLTATGQEKVRAGYDPLPAGFRQIPFNDLRAAEEAIDPEKTAGILVEPIQAEGGVVVADEYYLHGLRELCDRRGLLLIFDEVQTGMGRTGKLFGYEHFGVTPDIMTLAKALGGGLPLGAMLAREEVAGSFKPGSHASTFGGNPVACSAGLAVLDTLLHGGALKNCAKMSRLFVSGFERLRARVPFVRGVRGKGLLLGLELDIDGTKIVEECMQEGLLLNCTASKILRFAPPLTISAKEVERGLAILEKVLARH